MTPQTIVLDSEQRRARALDILGKLPLAQPWEVTIAPHKERRSSLQNARLWALHTRAGEVTGYAPEEMHEIALCRHFGYTERECKNPLTGEIELRRIPNKRSSQRDKKEFAGFMEATEAFYISELGVWLE